MSTIFNALLTNWVDVIFAWPSPLYILCGVLSGMIFGCIPGLNGPVLIALLIPITIPMGAFGAMLLVGAIMGAVTCGGSIPAILFNTPGTETNAATTIEGFPLAQKGEAALALGTAAVSSALGGIFGLLLLILILPFGDTLILAFSYPETFMVAVMGISLVVVISQGDVLKGIIAGLCGLMLTFIGAELVTGQARYTFGLNYLWSGIPFLAALIGLFAISEVIEMMCRGGTIAESKAHFKTGGPLQSMKLGFVTVFKNIKLFFVSGIVGFVVGVIPGVGGTVATFIAYMNCVQMAKDKSQFGKGDIRGVVAAECSNDAKDGGALLPTLLFGIPGSSVMAVLLGLFLLHGITPGLQVMRENLPLVATLINAHIVGNVLVAFFALLMAPLIARLTLIRVQIIAPVVLIFALLGSMSLSNQIIDVFVTITFGIIGYAFKKFGYSRVAVVIALVLGAAMEQAYQQTLIALGWKTFFTRPLSLIMFLCTIAVLGYGIFLTIRSGGALDDLEE